jgi:uncharacterized protein (DUF924 family)
MKRRLECSAIVDDPKDGWVGDVLTFWFEQTEPDRWFEKDPAFDASIRSVFSACMKVSYPAEVTASYLMGRPR